VSFRLRILFVILLTLYGGISLWPAWNRVHTVKHGRDFATYYYATQALLDGGDPYETPALSARARAEDTRRKVHPYFYPPPFLLGMLWVAPLSLKIAYNSWFWINQVFLVGLFWSFWRWLRVSPILLGLVAVTWSPITDNAKMGQANLVVLLLMVLALRWRSGLILSTAAMSKMSPALLLGWWGVRKWWRAIAGAVFGAIALSVLTLPLMDFQTQLRFYTDVLPGFSSGDYHGLTVRISLPANHSIPDMFNQVWPGETEHVLSASAQRASSVVSFGLLGALAWLSRRRRDAIGDACIAGAFTVLLLIIPVYTYEHHLVMMLLPVVALAAALQHGRIHRRWWPVLGFAYVVTAWPLFWLRTVQNWVPDASWVIQESKFFGMLTIGVACLVAALNSPETPQSLSEE